jgi:uncharacterized repeat protein (TIGR01451 family)
MRRLGFLLVGMLLFGVALPFQSYAQSRTQPTRAGSIPLRDSNDNPPVTSTRARTNALDQPDGSAKGVLDANGAQAGSFLAETWRTGIWGTGIGVSGIVPADLDGNGSLELILGGGSQFFGNYFWYIASYLPGSGRYEQIWMSRTYNQGFITAITTADANQDGSLEIYIALSSGMLEIYDGPTRELRATIVTGLQELSDVLVADPDSDGSQEILVSSPSGTKAYDPTTRGLAWQVAQGGSDLAVANVDADTTLEIVVNGHVLDGATRAVEWSFGFGSKLNVVDVDGDGKAEIIALQGWYKIFGFDAELKNRTWEITVQSEIAALYVADVDNNGRPDIVYGDGQLGYIHVLDGVTRQQRWQIQNPEHGVTRIAFGDVDGDGVTELLWGAGWTAAGDDKLFIADTASRTIKWSNIDIDGPLSALDVGDVDGDGRQEIVMIPFSNSQQNLIYIYDAETHALEWQSGPLQPANGVYWNRLESLRLDDVDADGRLDIVVATSYNGHILAYDGRTHTLKWQSGQPTSDAFNALAIADVDGDGSVEVIGSQYNTNGYLVILDGATGQEEWRTGTHSGWGGAKNIVVDDVDQDGNPDILFSMAGVAFMYDGVTRQKTWQSGSTISLVSSADVDGLPGPELLLGTDEGVLMVLDGKTRATKRTVTISTSALTALRLSDMDQDDLPELFITSKNYLYVYDPASWSKIWQSDWLSSLVADRNDLVVRDIDGDQIDEVVFGTSEAIVEFKFNQPPYALEVQASQQSVTRDQTIAYTATLTNLTDVSATLRLTDALPLHTELVSGSLQVTGGTATAEAGMAKWLVTLPASGQATMTLALRVSPAAPAGTVLTSTFSSDNGRFSITRRQSAAVENPLKRLYLPAMFVSAPASRPATR